MRFSLLMTICPADVQERVVDAAKAAGATGATLLSARGTGIKEAKTFFGLTLDRPQEAVVILSERGQAPAIMKAIYDAGNMVHPGNGVVFSMPIDYVMGLESQLTVLEREAEEHL